MYNRKIIIFIFTLFLIANISLFAEKITKVGVIDLKQIFQAFYEESKTLRELEEFRNDYEAELEKIDNEILSLEEKKIEAQKAGRDKEALQIQDDITKMKDYRREYYRIKTQEYQRRLNNIAQSNELWTEIIQAIKYIANRESYSVILRIDDPYLLFYTKDVDITQDVLEELLRRVRH